MNSISLSRVCVIIKELFCASVAGTENSLCVYGMHATTRVYKAHSSWCYSVRVCREVSFHVSMSVSRGFSRFLWGNEGGGEEGAELTSLFGELSSKFCGWIYV